MWVPSVVIRGCQILWSLSYKQLRATHCGGLGTEPGSTARAANALDHWTISPVPERSIIFILKINISFKLEKLNIFDRLIALPPSIHPSPLPPFLSYFFVLSSFLYFFLDRVSGSPGWPQTYCTTEDDLELLVLLFLSAGIISLYTQFIEYWGSRTSA